MEFPVLIIVVYGVLVGLGGILGYVKAQSRPSLLFGLASAIALLVCGWLASGQNPIGIKGAIGIGLLLSVFFGIRYARTRKLMPAGLMTVLSLVAVILLLTRALELRLQQRAGRFTVCPERPAIPLSFEYRREIKLNRIVGQSECASQPPGQDRTSRIALSYDAGSAYGYCSTRPRLLCAHAGEFFCLFGTLETRSHGRLSEAASTPGYFRSRKDLCSRPPGSEDHQGGC